MTPQDKNHIFFKETFYSFPVPQKTPQPVLNTFMEYMS